MISKIRIPSHHIPVNLVTWRAGRGRQLLLTPVLPGLALFFFVLFLLHWVLLFTEIGAQVVKGAGILKYLNIGTFVSF